MKGIIIVNAFSDIGKNQALRLQEEFSAENVCTDIVKNIGLRSDGYDFGVFLDKDIYTAITLENEGRRLFNSARTLAVCDDKMLTQRTLERAGIPCPETISSAFSFANDAPVSDDEAEQIIEKLGLPLVFKLNKSSLGAGVFLIKTRTELKEYISRYRATPHLYQKFIASSAGRDIRVIVIGGKAVASMERFNSNDFRSNIAVGGCARAFDITPEIENLAVRASEAVGSDYCGVDILLDDDGMPMICEVNSNAFFKGIEGVTGVNVARLYVKHILKTLS